MIHSQLSAPAQTYNPIVRQNATGFTTGSNPDSRPGQSPSVVRGVLAQLTFFPRVTMMGVGHAMRGLGMEAMNRQDEFNSGPSFSGKVGRMFDELKASNRFNGV